jgi:hypothetical protein
MALTGFSRPAGSNAPRRRKLYVALESDVATIPDATDGVVSTDITMETSAVFYECEIVEETGEAKFERTGFEGDSVSYTHMVQAFVAEQGKVNDLSLEALDNKRCIVIAEGNNGTGDMHILGEKGKGLIVRTEESEDADRRGFLFIASQSGYSHTPYKYSGAVTTS